MSETLAQIGELEILTRLKQFVPAGQIDDDTALIHLSGENLIINTDMLVEGVHFSEKTTSPQDVGWRAIAANISDLAASGAGQIIGITVGLVAPPQTEWDWVHKVYIGIEKALKSYGGDLLGGDCSCGQQRILSITAIGKLGPIRLHRSNARPGDYLVVSGAHGLSRLGLALLSADPLAQTKLLTDRLKQLAILQHQRPIPPLQALRTLELCKPNYLPWRAAGTDSSDGLLEAVRCLSSSSGCQAVLNPNELPRSHDWPQGSHWDEWCLNGGEDFQLVLSLPQEWGKAWLKAFPASREIGYMKHGDPKVTWPNGTTIQAKKSSTFKHF